MEALIILVIISICTALVFLVGFLWSVRSGQYTDMDSPAVRMLINDANDKNKKSTKP
jgi:cbb3-type cytochrome oxidase maturation protein